MSSLALVVSDLARPELFAVARALPSLALLKIMILILLFSVKDIVIHVLLPVRFEISLLHLTPHHDTYLTFPFYDPRLSSGNVLLGTP